MVSAVVDRLTDNGQALLLVESLQEQFHVDVATLPVGSGVGTWLVAEIVEGKVLSLSIDEEKTVEMKKEIGDRLARLQSKKSSRFKRQ